MLEIALLAQEVVAVIAPVLPTLIEEGQETIGEINNEYGYVIHEKANRLWSKLHPHLAKRPGAGEVINHLANEPHDEDACGALRLQIRWILSEDDKLADEVQQIADDKKEASKE